MEVITTSCIENQNFEGYQQTDVSKRGVGTCYFTRTYRLQVQREVSLVGKRCWILANPARPAWRFTRRWFVTGLSFFEIQKGIIFMEGNWIFAGLATFWLKPNTYLKNLRPTEI